MAVRTLPSITGDSPLEHLLRSKGFLLMALLGLHIPLALLMQRLPLVATVHALATAAVGLGVALSGRQLERAAYMAAYVMGAEVLWHMSAAGVFYEFGDYTICAIFLAALMRSYRLKHLVLPGLYFLMLLPSTILTLASTDLADARSQISFNLSGPLALAISAWFFSNVKLSRDQIQHAFWAALGPIVGIATIALSGIVTAARIVYTTTSNLSTSGGWGPDQVSAALGLGALLAYLLILDGRVIRPLRVLMLGLMTWLAIQSALTFSREGVYTAAGGAALATLVLARDGRTRIRVLLLIPIVLLVVNYGILPRLESLTQGALGTRFQDTRVTGRDQIVGADLALWAANPLLGVGPGDAKELRGLAFGDVAAHIEFSRLLAEHGLFGLIAIGLILFMAVRNFWRAPTLWDKALVSALIGCSFLMMTAAAMRVAAPALLFGLSFTLLPDPEDAAAPNPWPAPRPGEPAPRPREPAPTALGWRGR